MAASTFESLRRSLLDRSASQPFITFYDTGTGERTELSHLTTDNWVAKTANLVLDLGFAETDRIVIDLPAHWQTGVWHLTAWATGLVQCPRGEHADLQVVTTDAIPTAHAGTVIACSLRPLGLPSPDPLPAGVIDYAVEVRAHGDQFAGPAPGPDDPASPHESQAEAVAAARSASQRRGLSPGARLLLAGADAPTVAEALACALVLGGSLVVITGPVDSDQLARIESTERTDARFARSV